MWFGVADDTLCPLAVPPVQSHRALHRKSLCRPWERGRLARCPRVAASCSFIRSFKRASHLEFVSRDQASSGRAARAPRRCPFTRADFWCTARSPVTGS